MSVKEALMCTQPQYQIAACADYAVTVPVVGEFDSISYDQDVALTITALTNALRRGVSPFGYPGPSFDPGTRPSIPEFAAAVWADQTEQAKIARQGMMTMTNK